MVVNGHILIRNLMHTNNLSIYQHKICLPLPEILLDQTGFTVVLQFTVYLHQDKLGIQDFCVSDAEAFINHGYS